MRDYLAALILISGLSVGAPAVAAEAAAPPTGPRQIDKLITQLGSARFKEREAATQALDAAGAAALPALERAARGQDPEVCRRAEGLAHEIHKRLETAELLKPKLVHLAYTDTPLADAIADLAKK